MIISIVFVKITIIIVVLNNLEQTLTYIIQPCCIQSQLNLERALTGYHIYFATYTKLPNSKYMSFPPKITFLKLSECSIVQIELKVYFVTYTKLPTSCSIPTSYLEYTHMFLISTTRLPISKLHIILFLELRNAQSYKQINY